MKNESGPVQQDKSKKSESQKILDRVDRDSQSLTGSRFEIILGQSKRHFSAGDKDDKDAAEVWGTRIARVLALLCVAYLIYHLLSTYG